MLLMPIIYIISYSIVGNQKGPYYWTPNQNDYAYLLDSLNLVNTNPVAIFQGPGIPLQILGAGIIIISHAIQTVLNSSNSAINEAVLSQPELYLSIINYTLLGVTAVALFVLGITTSWLSKNLLLSLVLQATPLMMAVSLLKNEPSRVAPEVLVFAVSQLLVTLLIIYLYRDKAARSLWFSVCLGLVFGLGMASKIFFLPTVIFILLIPGVLRKLVAGLAAILAFVVGICPAINKFEQFATELLNVILPKQSIEAGDRPSGILGLLENLGLLIANNLIFFVIVITLTIVSIGIILLAKYGQGSFKITLVDNHHKKLLKLSYLVAIAVWLQVFLAIQNYGQNQVLIPALGLAGFMMFLIIQLCLIGLTGVIQDVLEPTTFAEFVVIIGLASCVAIGIHQVYSASQFISGRSNLRYAEAQSVQSIITQNQTSKQCAVALYRRASTIPSALKFAELRTDDRFGAILDRLYPNTIFYSEDSKTYESFSQSLDPARLFNAEQTCILFRTNPLIGRRSRLRDSEELQKIFIGKTEVVYQIAP
jgi:hypothetical protein